MEMEQWWKRNSEVKLGVYTKAEVEDITGCIPLLLDKCVENGEIDLGVKTLRDIHHQAVSFEQKIIKEWSDNNLYWGLYVELVQPLKHS